MIALKMLVGCAVVAFHLALMGCAQVPAAPKVDAQPKLQFLDVERFDSEVASAMAAPLPSIEVAFYARVSPNQMPERLQKWMAAVESRGGKVAVTEPPVSGLQPRSLMLVASAISSLWTANRALQQAVAEARFRAAAGYDAEIKLRDDGAGGRVIEKIVFTRRSP